MDLTDLTDLLSWSVYKIHFSKVTVVEKTADDFFALTVIASWRATRCNCLLHMWADSGGGRGFLGREVDPLELSALGSQAALGSPSYRPRNDLALNLLQSHIWLRLETGQNTCRKFHSDNKSHVCYFRKKKKKEINTFPKVKKALVATRLIATPVAV